MTTSSSHDISGRRDARVRRGRAGFSVVELTVAMAIIVVLITLVVPLVGRMNRKAKETSTAAFLQSLSVAIENYYQDFKAYPGPLGNDQIHNSSNSPPITPASNYPSDFVTWTDTDADQITMSENLVLGLIGGLRVEVSGANLTLRYDPAQVGRGPMSLNPSNPKNYGAYAEVKNLSWRTEAGKRTGKFKDDVGEANDSIIPEFVDTFGDPLPILYLRAKRGATPRFVNATENPVITNDPNLSNGRPGQYDLTQIIGYTDSDIGAGKKLPDYVSTGSITNQPPGGNVKPKHGLRSVNPGATLSNPPPSGLGYLYPYDAFAYFRDPSLSGAQTGSTPGRQIPRQKDKFILISAGADRIYGTKDDITSFGSVTP